ncbi:MAG TPA: patatin-like phospholipase family protein, partial [Candidatus Limnocylindrales bacterium]|nr:patatin-like phospholipase family protein [Candidatus Limnocylindrales bacterium]
MNVGIDQASATPPIQEPYSPRLRTALVLTGTGTSGAYHAGVLRALHEAGVKIDVVAGRGIGAVGALFAAIDGAQHLWDETGFWRQPAVKSLYRWKATIRVMAGALGVSVAVVAVPLVAVALGLLVFPLDFLLRIIGAGGATGLVDWYTALAKQAAAPEAMPTWLPRLVLLVLGFGAAVAGAVGLGHSRGRVRGAFWWRFIQPPLGSQAAVTHCWRVMWNLVRGAAQLKQPSAAELGCRYTEVLADNLGQPGFHELLIVVHDLDARRDLVFALVAEARRHLLGWHPA